MAKIHGYVYLVRCLADGKVYIGCTTQSVEQRWRLHCSAAKTNPKSEIAKAIALHGLDAFQVFTLRIAKDREEMLLAEYENILLHQAHDPEFGYNRVLQKPYPRYGALAPCYHARHRDRELRRAA